MASNSLQCDSVNAEWSQALKGGRRSKGICSYSGKIKERKGQLLGPWWCPKGLVCPSKPRENRAFGGISRKVARISEVPRGGQQFCCSSGALSLPCTVVYKISFHDPDIAYTTSAGEGVRVSVAIFPSSGVADHNHSISDRSSCSFRSPVRSKCRAL